MFAQVLFGFRWIPFKVNHVVFYWRTQNSPGALAIRWNAGLGILCRVSPRIFSSVPSHVFAIIGVDLVDEFLQCRRADKSFTRIRRVTCLCSLRSASCFLLKDAISRVSGQTRLRRSAGVPGTKSSFRRSDMRDITVCFLFMLSRYHFYRTISTR